MHDGDNNTAALLHLATASVPQRLLYPYSHLQRVTTMSSILRPTAETEQVRSRYPSRRGNPLQESPSDVNNKVVLSRVTDLTVLLSPTKSSGRKFGQKTSGGSPARRTPRAMSSPAKRNPVPAMTEVILASSSSNRVLRSPSRIVKTDLPTHKLTTSQLFHSRETFSVIDPFKDMQAPKSSSVALEPITGEVTSLHRSRLSSPLKRPARQMHEQSSPSRSRIALCQPASGVDPTSPLKKPPVRNVRGSSPAKAQDELPELLRSPTLAKSLNDISEPVLSLSPSKNCTAERIAKHQEETLPSMRRRSALVSCNTRLPVESNVVDAENQLVSESFTPIRVPPTVQFVESPPSEDTIEAEDDHWSPSVPMFLTKSFAQLCLSSPTSPRSKEQEIQSSEGSPSPMGQDSQADFIVYVDCISSNSGKSRDHFDRILSQLGAKTLKRWNWNPETQGTPSKRPRVGLTHVVFFGGSARTLKKVRAARKMGVQVQCVGLSWVMQCRQSQRLTIGAAGHEVDVEAELDKLSKPLKSAPTYTTPKKQGPVVIAVEISAPEIGTDYLAPVKFDDAPNIFTTEHFMPARSVLPIPTISPTKAKPVVMLTELESRQLELARKNSAKFKPAISSPLSKKAWRA